MKKNLVLLVFTLCLLHAVAAQEGNIVFNQSTWAEILAEADRENKVIFMDAYTDWCGSCKQMSSKVFTQKTVADFYNATFINVKMNMEKGEGIALSEKYKVIAYPTLLFIDGKGSLLHRAVGYHDTDDFLALGETANTPGLRLSNMEERYAFGDRSADFLYDYTFARAEGGDGTQEKIAADYLSTQEDWGSEKNLSFLFRFMESAEGQMFDYFLENKDKFVQMFGESPVARKLQYMIASSVEDKKEDSALEQVARLYEKVYPEAAPRMTSEYAMMYYLRAGDTAKYVQTSKAHYNKYGTEDWESLNETAWNFYEYATDKKDLEQAVKWAARSVDLESNYYNNDTLAALYYKLGSKKKATKTAKKAIAMAKVAGEDFSATQELLAKIKAL